MQDVHFPESYPPLDASSPASAQLDSVKEDLLRLASCIHDRLEIVPAERAAYVYYGRPPKMFGIAWVNDGQAVNFKKMVNEMGLSTGDIQNLTIAWKNAYEAHGGEEKFSYKLGGKSVTVIPSPDLAAHVGDIIRAVSRT